jgi:GDP/UDP-N,N'-diacetylbacillosamine 2-epimerase (hydrolysing)
LPIEKDITKSLKKMFSKEFTEFVKSTVNPFGDGTAAKKITEVIKNTSLDNILKKKFYNQ